MSKEPVIVGFSGTQGCGKSTQLKKLERVPAVCVDYNQTARTVVKELDITFNQSYYSNPQLVAKCQLMVLIKMLEHDIDRLQMVRASATKWIISDRSYMDLHTYTLANLAPYPEFSDFITAYGEMCAISANQVYDSIILFPYPHFPLVSDGVRPTSEHYRLVVQSVFRALISEYSGTVTTISQSAGAEQMFNHINTKLSEASNDHTLSLSKRVVVLKGLLQSVLSNPIFTEVLSK